MTLVHHRAAVSLSLYTYVYTNSSRFSHLENTMLHHNKHREGFLSMYYHSQLFYVPSSQYKHALDRVLYFRKRTQRQANTPLFADKY